jgi:outer membrane protein assembly factor BamB
VVVAEPGGRVRLLDGTTGVVLWTVDLPYGDDWVISVTGDDRTVAVLGAPPADGAPRVARVTGLGPADGTVRWSHLAMTRSSRPTAAVVGDVIVLTDVLGDGVLSAIDTTTGLLRWQTAVGAPLQARAGAGRVVAAVDERLVVLDATSGLRTADVRAPARITTLVEVTPAAATMLTDAGPLTVALPPTG